MILVIFVLKIFYYGVSLTEYFLVLMKDPRIFQHSMGLLPMYPSLFSGLNYNNSTVVYSSPTSSWL